MGGGGRGNGWGRRRKKTEEISPTNHFFSLSSLDGGTFMSSSTRPDISYLIEIYPTHFKLYKTLFHYSKRRNKNHMYVRTMTLKIDQIRFDYSSLT